MFGAGVLLLGLLAGLCRRYDWRRAPNRVDNPRQWGVFLAARPCGLSQVDRRPIRHGRGRAAATSCARSPGQARANPNPRASKVSASFTFSGFL